MTFWDRQIGLVEPTRNLQLVSEWNDPGCIWAHDWVSRKPRFRETETLDGHTDVTKHPANRGIAVLKRPVDTPACDDDS